MKHSSWKMFFPPPPSFNLDCCNTVINIYREILYRFQGFQHDLSSGPNFEWFQCCDVLLKYRDTSRRFKSILFAPREIYLAHKGGHKCIRVHATPPIFHVLSLVDLLTEGLKESMDRFRCLFTVFSWNVTVLSWWEQLLFWLQDTGEVSHHSLNLTIVFSPHLICVDDFAYAFCRHYCLVLFVHLMWWHRHHEISL